MKCGLTAKYFKNIFSFFGLYNHLKAIFYSKPIFLKKTQDFL